MDTNILPSQNKRNVINNVHTIYRSYGDFNAVIDTLKTDGRGAVSNGARMNRADSGRLGDGGGGCENISLFTHTYFIDTEITK